MTPDRPSRTAEIVCMMRATEQLVPAEKRVLDDPYAPWFLGTVWRSRLAAMRAAGRLVERAPMLLPGMTAYIVTRHRLMDDALAAALPGVEQVVLLGAGYDTRAWRFASKLGKKPIFEVDHPATAKRKASIVEAHRAELPSVDDRQVTIDFETERLDEKLVAAGFRVGRPTFFTWEGVSMYLTRAAVKDTLGTLHRLGGPGTRLTMDFWQMLDQPDLIATAHRVSAGLLSLLGEPVTFGIHPEDVGPFLERLGWKVVDLADPQELQKRYLPDGRRIYPANFVLTAERI